jgi:hypothetical protein
MSRECERSERRAADGDRRTCTVGEATAQFQIQRFLKASTSKTAAVSVGFGKPPRGAFFRARARDLFRGGRALQSGERGQDFFAVFVGLHVEPHFFHFALRVDQESVPRG